VHGDRPKDRVNRPTRIAELRQVGPRQHRVRVREPVDEPLRHAGRSLELARLVDDPNLAERPEDAYRRDVKSSRSKSPNAPPSSPHSRIRQADLAELRGVLLRELAWPREEGIA
jgi:hypothetical protein